MKWKRSELIWYWADCMTLPIDHTHDLDLGVEISRSESEIALSQEWDSLLTWNEKDASNPFMTMILTSVTMVGWADVPHSDWGDFRRRRAIDIFSFDYFFILWASFTDTYITKYWDGHKNDSIGWDVIYHLYPFITSVATVELNWCWSYSSKIP